LNDLELVAGVLAVVALPLPWLAPTLRRAVGFWGYLLSTLALCGVTLLLTQDVVAVMVVAGIALVSAWRRRGAGDDAAQA